MLLTRIVSGVVLIAIVAGALLLGGWVVVALVAVAAALAAWELGSLLHRVSGGSWSGFDLLWVILLLVLALEAVWTNLGGDRSASSLVLGLAGAALMVGLALVSVLLAQRRGYSIEAVRRSGLAPVLTVYAALYVGFGLGSYLLLLRWRSGDSGFGLRLVVLIIAGVVACDTAAYFTGSAIGRHRFFPGVSPKKSVEGAVGGVAGSILVVGLAGGPLVGLSAASGLVLGALLAAAAQLGDLAESALKRLAQVKDSSRLIPGHGGLLDRLDSLILVAPIVYCFSRLISL